MKLEFIIKKVGKKKVVHIDNRNALIVDNVTGNNNKKKWLARFTNLLMLFVLFCDDQNVGGLYLFRKKFEIKDVIQNYFDV